MFMGLGMPIPDLSNKPGPGRPGYGPTGTYDFQFEVTGAVTIKAQPAATGTFTIKWPNGTEQTTAGSNSIAAPDATAGIVSINNEELDTTYADEFAVVGGQTNVTKVISWGQNAWSKMHNAFSGCTSLSDISTTSFISYEKNSSANGDMRTMFDGCTSLLEADIKNWDLTAGANWYGGSPFRGLVNLQKLDATGLNVKLISRVDNAFAGIGTAVTDGCEFLMSGFNMSTSTAVTTPYLFDSSRIKPTSDLSNWVFNPNGFDGTGVFRNIQLTGTNSTLNCSGWSTYSGSKFPSFQGSNAGAGNTGAKVNLTNLNLSNTNSFATSFQSTDFSGIIGLSTWGATAGNVSMYRAFYYADYFKFDNSDNFSSTFIESLTPTGTSFRQVFDRTGKSLASNYGDAPNITNIDLSGVSDISAAFTYSRFKNVPDFASATFNSSGVSFNQLFLGARFSDTDSHFDFSNIAIKITNTNQMFRSAWIDKVTFGNNVDFSSLTTVSSMHYYMNSGNPNGTTTELTYPTNADFSSLTTTGNWFAGTVGPTTGPLTTCQVDNLIRRFRATAYGNALNVNFYQSQITEAPSLVRAQEAELVANGWTITENATDATIPFEYTGDLEPDTNITPTNNTGSAFTGTFSSSNSTNIPVVATGPNAGLINTPNGGNTTIRYTLPDGCFTEQAISLVSAEFSYSASAYCQDAATDPTPTVTGTSGGTFTAAEKFFPFQMQFEVASGVSKTITIPKTVGSSYTVDWGDGAITTESGSVSGANISHTYNDGTNTDVTNPTVSIGAVGDTGPFTMFKFNNGGSKSDLLDVPQWGSIVFHDLYQMFDGCNNVNFQISATDAPTFSNTGNKYIAYAFYNATYFNSDISHWDVSNLAGSWRNAFSGSSFNQNLSSWAMVTTNLFGIFWNATSLSPDNYTDTLVGWAVQVYKNSGTPNLISFVASHPSFTGTKTSDAASGQTYAAKYGSDWTATGWTTAQDAKNYLTTSIASGGAQWTIS